MRNTQVGMIVINALNQITELLKVVASGIAKVIDILIDLKNAVMGLFTTKDKK